MINTIIFDIGRVLLEFEPKKYLEAKFSEEVVDELFEHVFSRDEWLELDKGTIDEEMALEIIAKRIPHRRGEISELLEGWHELLIPIAGTVEILHRLKEKKYKIYLLSNFHFKAFEKVSNQFDFFQIADGKIISSHVKYLKPQKEIYEALMVKYNLQPSECLFIDDTKENLEGAKKIGINTIHFISATQLEEDLLEVGIL
ncbi:HAD family hydrolase [Alkaliphilus peptidifermentans]|uniref:Putative hydrolase of the HAD superfamily n=1 Tax=Alkaliphilus peptidifermentans DSM 18978 TaxID=1120976 RepID=A0A1G5AUT2_9FIRM|nr:HAD family phosphatase [Alkaliphilus peptidifermentans]SCX81590.1 putative hydrolase of the HAD superfamily [Alkaliphilus peptidifermentans DSM 18978]